MAQRKKKPVLALLISMPGKMCQMSVTFLPQNLGTNIGVFTILNMGKNSQKKGRKFTILVTY